MPDLYLVLSSKQEQLAAQQIKLQLKLFENILLYFPCILLKLKFFVLADLLYKCDKKDIDLWDAVEFFNDYLLGVGCFKDVQKLDQIDLDFFLTECYLTLRDGKVIIKDEVQQFRIDLDTGLGIPLFEDDVENTIVNDLEKEVLFLAEYYAVVSWSEGDVILADNDRILRNVEERKCVNFIEELGKSIFLIEEVVPKDEGGLG